MPHELDRDFTSLEFDEKDIELPVDPTDRAKGTVHVTVRELPYGAKHACEYRYLAASIALDKGHSVLGSILKGDIADAASIDLVGGALASLRLAETEMIRWGVVGHKGFLLHGEPFPFETSDKNLAGVVYQVASDKMLRLYKGIAAKKFFEVGPNFFSVLAAAVKDFQSGLIHTADELYQAGEKKPSQASDNAPAE